MRATRLVVLSAAPLLALATVAPAVAAPSDPARPTRLTAPIGTAARIASRPPAASSTSALDRQAIAAVSTAGPAATEPAVTLVARAAPGTATPTLRTAVLALGLSPRSDLATLGYVSVTVPAAAAATERARLAAAPGVASVSIAAPRTPYSVPTDPLYATRQATMYSRVHGPAAWDASTGSGITIAILDAGFDAAHEDLAAKVASTWDVVAHSTVVTDPAGATVPGHGTATSSVAAAATDNGLGIAGAAPAAGLMLVKVSDAAGGLNSAGSAAGILYATDHGAAVISMSYGGSSLDPVEASAVAYAVAHGVVVVAAAGNNGTAVPTYPAADPGVISVGATSNDGTTRATFSNYGSWVDVAAPGVAIPVAVPIAVDTQDGAKDGYTLMDGTSFSAPLVAGEAALLLAEHPTTAPATVASIIESTAAAAPTGFAHGLVDFDAAVVAASAADTVLTAPADGTTVAGDVVVSATSGMPKVRFDVVGTTTSVTVPVTAGVATATLPSYGLDGSHTVRARGCDATTCGKEGPAGVARVVVGNAAPVLTAPLDGAAAGLSFVVAATAAGGAVRSYADGTVPLALDAVAPYSVTIDTSVLANGAHAITAVSCTVDGRQCDTAHPSGAASITVARLRPSLRVGPNPFSPNADRRRDVAVATFTLEQPQAIVLRVFGPTGAVVRGPLSLGSKATGTYSWTWDGRTNARGLVPDGSYRLELATSRVVGAGTPAQQTVRGLVSATVRSDRTRPGLTAVVPSARTVFPVKDSYYDTVPLGATSREALSAVTVYVRNAAGRTVRTLTSGSRPAGRVAIAWDGRTSSHALLPAGTYRFQVLAQDVAGNRALSAVGSVVLSRKKLSARSATATVVPLASVMSAQVGACSAVFKAVRSGAPGSLGYYSNYLCASGVSGDDLAAVEHAYTLPSAIRYGTVHVTATGGSASGYADHAVLLYYDRTGALSSAGATLAAPYTTHAAPAVAASTYLFHGRELWWLVTTTGGNWYDVVQFHVLWTYYVLV